MVAAAASFVFFGIETRAAANGAFPDSLQILLPPDRPQEIVLSTNFGLIVSEDAGANWSWTCEEPATSGANLYSMGAPPLDRIFAVGPAGLAHSDDEGCTWALASGLAASSFFVDAFPDPTDSRRVWMIVSSSGRTASDQVFLSSDAGDTMGSAMFAAPSGAILTGVESARSDPQTVYATMLLPNMGADLAPQLPALARSNDGGRTWSTFDATGAVGTSELRIMSVDPDDSQTLYLRSVGPFAESVVLSVDGGVTLTTPLSIESGMITAFARLASGALVVSAMVANTPVAYRSADGGKTFVELPGAPYLRELAERGGTLFGATDNLYESDWAVGTSSDEGSSFRSLMAYEQVKTVKACVSTTCNAGCQSEASMFLWSPSVCSANPDAAAEPDGGQAADARPPGGSTDEHGADHMAGSCACATHPGGTALPGAPAVLALATIYYRRRRRR